MNEYLQIKWWGYSCNGQASHPGGGGGRGRNTPRHFMLQNHSRTIEASGFDAEFTLKVNLQMYLMWSITLALLFLCADEVMDVQEECAKFGAVRGFKYDGDSTAGYKVA